MQWPLAVMTLLDNGSTLVEDCSSMTTTWTSIGMSVTLIPPPLQFWIPDTFTVPRLPVTTLTMVQSWLRPFVPPLVASCP